MTLNSGLTGRTAYSIKKFKHPLKRTSCAIKIEKKH